MLTPVDIDRVERDLREAPRAIRCIDRRWQAALKNGTPRCWYEIWLILFGASIDAPKEHRDDYSTLLDLAIAHEDAALATGHGGVA